MFKVICDLVAIDLDDVIDRFPDGTIAPAVNKYNKVIAYRNCKPCSVGDLKLTSTSNFTSHSQAKIYSNAWGTNVFSPVNGNLYKLYDDIFEHGAANKFDLKKFKHISLFENDAGFATGPTPTVTQLFEVTIDSTHPLTTSSSNKDGYKAGYKEHLAIYSIITSHNDKQNNLTKSPFFDSKGNHQYTISKELIAYTLSFKGALSCPEIQSKSHIGDGYFVHGDQIYNKEIYEEVKFLEYRAIEKVKQQLLMERDCIVNNDWVISIASPESKKSSSIDDIKSDCRKLGGKLEPEQITMELLCSQKIPTFEFTGNSLFSIRCDNYKSYLQFDTDGEILGNHLIRHSPSADDGLI